MNFRDTTRATSLASERNKRSEAREIHATRPTWRAAMAAAMRRRALSAATIASSTSVLLAAINFVEKSLEQPRVFEFAILKLLESPHPAQPISKAPTASVQAKAPQFDPRIAVCKAANDQTHNNTGIAFEKPIKLLTYIYCHLPLP